MININLIIKPKPKINWRRVAATTLTGAVIMGFGVYAVNWWSDYHQLQEEVAGLTQLEATYRKVIAQGKTLKDREAEVLKQEQQLALTGRNQAPWGQADVLQAVFAAAPADVAVNEVAIDKNQALLLSGQAPDFDAAMRFLRALQALPALTAVEERKLATVTKGITTFTFAAKVRREGAP
ncbi:MAG TPA: PilN domain-containing protein [Symbiobacteriaceae bacterium]|nr:PilN domain-containing protein [Symbiobacteriaceae bacterium]